MPNNFKATGKFSGREKINPKPDLFCIATRLLTKQCATIVAPKNAARETLRFQLSATRSRVLEDETGGRALNYIPHPTKLTDELFHSIPRPIADAAPLAETGEDQCEAPAQW